MDQSHDFSRAGWQLRSINMRTALIAFADCLPRWEFPSPCISSRGGEFGVGGIFSVRSEGDAGLAQPRAGPEASRQTTLPRQNRPPAASSSPGAAAAAKAVERVEQVVEQQGGLDSRVAAMEQRLTRLDMQSQAAAGNAARAEGLLIAFASRRAIERGAPLGYLADQLRLRFGEARPNAVQTVIDAAQDPVTLDRLVARLEGIAPVLNDAPADEGVFTMLGRELSSLFIVRRDDTPSPVAERRLERARLFLESGRIAPAVQEIRGMPNAVEAESWIADAETFAAAQRALETLETAAVLDPRGIRDAEGEQVQQLSPALPGAQGVN